MKLVLTTTANKRSDAHRDHPSVTPEGGSSAPLGLPSGRRAPFCVPDLVAGQLTDFQCRVMFLGSHSSTGSAACRISGECRVCMRRGRDRGPVSDDLAARAR